MTKHINDLIQKSIDVPSEKLIIEYVIENKRLEKRIEELEQKLEQTEKDLADYQFNYPSIKELEKENAELKRNKKTVVHLADCLEEKQNERIEELEKKIKRVRYTLNKIIETVCNDRIDEYGARLVLINDFAYKCLQEIKDE